MPLTMKSYKLLLLFLLFNISGEMSFAFNKLQGPPVENPIKYFLIDQNSPDYKTNRITLNAQELYQKNEPIELINLQFDKNSLILFSVLPEGSSSWEEIDKLTTEKQVLGFTALKELFKSAFDVYRTSNGLNDGHLKRDDIRLVFKVGNKYQISRFCITEFFQIIQQPMIFPNQMGNPFINIESPMLNVKQFEDKSISLFKTLSPNAIKSAEATGTSPLLAPMAKPLLFRSGSVQINGKEAYKFWQYAGWNVADGSNFRRGIDRFLFMPGIGIIGGSFDFYFQHRVSNELLLKNYLSEQLMFPLSINGKPINQ